MQCITMMTVAMNLKYVDVAVALSALRKSTKGEEHHYS